MVTVTSIGGRAVALIASAVAHAAVAAAALTGGHAPESARASFSVTPSAEIVVDVVPPEPVVVDNAPPPPLPQAPQAVANHVHTHTHPYPVPFDHDAHPHDPSIVHTAVGPHAPDDDHDHDHAEAIEAPAVATAPVEAAPARFTMVIGAANVASGAVANDGHHGDGDHDRDVAPIVEGSSLATPAKRVSGVDPVYPDRAKAEGIEVDVPVEIVIDARGAVESARATKHVGYGLDEAAVTAVRAWRFSPRTASGKPVRVRLVWPVAFRLIN